MGSDHVSEVLAEVFRRGGMKRAVRRAEAVLLWPQVAGPELARFATARALKDGVLYVEVSDSETSMHLSLQRQRFLDAYRGRFGVSEVREIRFRVGRPAPPAAPEAPPAPPPVDGRELARLARDLGDLELGELTGPAMQAGKAMLQWRAAKLAEGWRPCPTCGALSPDGGACDACRRYAADTKVIRASQRLTVDPLDPAPLLSDDERAVAVRLALDFLDEGMMELLPQVLAEPRLRPQLERVARCWLALGRGVGLDAITDDDYQRLEPRVARALGRWR